MKYTPIFTALVLLLPLLVASTKRHAYIVYFGKHSGEKTHREIEEYHRSYLYSLKESVEEAKNSLLYSYKNSINGFAALLTSDEALKLSELNEVVSVFQNKARKLHTTRSWEFLDVREGTTKSDLLLKANYGKEMIVGLVDTGIWPESKSFSDEGMGEIPKKWKGICQNGDVWNSTHCNKKIIGARYYSKGFESSFGSLDPKVVYRSARDSEGHGTHTSSTIGGQIIQASITGGFGNGTASGGAPLAHLAIYKVCWILNPISASCTDVDMLAAIDDAIGDGVDVLSVSIGYGNDVGYINDIVALGYLHAMENNIVVACSAGNSGPDASSVQNAAPWVITVAASSIDRAFLSPPLLGNNVEIPGESVTAYELKEMHPLAYAVQIEEADVAKEISGFCIEQSLSPEKTKGKIVVCRKGGFSSNIAKGKVVKEAGGAGLIVANNPEDGDDISVEPHVLPATAIGFSSFSKVLKYINSTQNPTAQLSLARTTLNVKPAPFMARFSSRGPNPATPDILKPDITAPGVNILAAWTEAPPQSWMEETSEKFKIISGTSMACPHVAGVITLLKAIHPTWSSAAIRSAIMTTAFQTDNLNKLIADTSGNVADPFQYGSGHINPTKAVDPGLVYDASYNDYLLFLCSLYGKSGDTSFKCPPNPPSALNLNYPSISISKLNGVVTIDRVVTNVGNYGTTYVSNVEAPQGVSVKISPTQLTFKGVGDKGRFQITVGKTKSWAKKNVDGYVFGWYSWSDGVHIVRSPIAINLA